MHLYGWPGIQEERDSYRNGISMLFMKDNYFEGVLFVFNLRANAETYSGYSL